MKAREALTVCAIWEPHLGVVAPRQARNDLAHVLTVNTYQVSPPAHAEALGIITSQTLASCPSLPILVQRSSSVEIPPHPILARVTRFRRAHEGKHEHHSSQAQDLACPP